MCITNCSPENNKNNGGVVKIIRKKILAAINNNKKINPQVKKHLKKSIEKENKITQVNQKI